jgi:hypothetical protein
LTFWRAWPVRPCSRRSTSRASSVSQAARSAGEGGFESASKWRPGWRQGKAGRSAAFGCRCGARHATGRQAGRLPGRRAARSAQSAQHAEVSGDHGPPGFSRGKCDLYDFGVAVALAVRWPGGTGGRVVEDFVNFMDLTPTFREAGGVKIPKGVDGRSFLNVLKLSKSGLVDETCAPPGDVSTTRIRWRRSLTFWNRPAGSSKSPHHRTRSPRRGGRVVFYRLPNRSICAARVW